MAGINSDFSTREMIEKFVTIAHHQMTPPWKSQFDVHHFMSGIKLPASLRQPLVNHSTSSSPDSTLVRLSRTFIVNIFSIHLSFARLQTHLLPPHPAHTPTRKLISQILQLFLRISYVQRFSVSVLLVSLFFTAQRSYAARSWES